MTTPLRDVNDAKGRLNRFRRNFDLRNKMVAFCNELYLMLKERKSGYLPGEATAWRDRIPSEYWESSNRPHNVVDVMTAVLSGHAPQYQCVIPGGVVNSIPSRAELFLDGAWRLNSRRQQVNLYREIVFRTVKDGACGIRVYWTPNPEPAQATETIPHPDFGDAAPPIVVQTHNDETFPINLEVISISQLYPGGRGYRNKPFSELFYVQKRTVGDVIDEWEGEADADLEKMVKGIKREEDRYIKDEEYIEWWGQDKDGVVWYAIIFQDQFIVEPTETQYPDIPFIITSFKKVDTEDPSMQTLPFLYPTFQAIEKLDYVRARGYRMIDLFANLAPYHSGETPIAMNEATWGKVLELGPKEDIKFPQWPGQPPDVYREMQEIQSTVAQGSFSDAMFGQVSSRVSGYALSQVLGSDTLRTDLPRGNLELAYSAVADLVFGLLNEFAPDTYLAVTAAVTPAKAPAILSGAEAQRVVVWTTIKPKQTSDEARLAALGAQLASLPNPPVSTYYILERFFGVHQPEEEISRRLDEEALKDPVVRLLAISEVLEQNGKPDLAQYVLAQVQGSIGGQQPPGAPAPPGPEQAMAGVGMGMPQAMQGNPPVIPPSGNPREENLTREGLMMGGPREEF